MRFCFIALLFLTGCNEGAFFKGNTVILNATCYMKNFKDFPDRVSGPVVLQLKNYLTIRVDNKDKSESVEMTFPKSKCKVK